MIVGVSPDSVASHEKFKAKMSFPFELLADEDQAVCELFDVFKEKSMYGRKYMGVERSTFLIDADGVLRQEWRKVKVPGHADEVLAAAQGALRRAAESAPRRRCAILQLTLRRVPCPKATTAPDDQARSAAATRNAPATPHLRARHERADARSDRDLPLRRARRLHPDDRARGARRRARKACRKRRATCAR